MSVLSKSELEVYRTIYRNRKLEVAAALRSDGLNRDYTC